MKSIWHIDKNYWTILQKNGFKNGLGTVITLNLFVQNMEIFIELLVKFVFDHMPNECHKLCMAHS